MKVVTFCKHWNPFWQVPDKALEVLRKEFPQISFVRTEKHEDLAREIPDAEILLGYELDPTSLDSATILKWIHVPAANVYQFIRKDLRERKILVTNARGDARHCHFRTGAWFHACLLSKIYGLLEVSERTSLRPTRSAKFIASSIGIARKNPGDPGAG